MHSARHATAWVRLFGTSIIRQFVVAYVFRWITSIQIYKGPTDLFQVQPDTQLVSWFGAIATGYAQSHQFAR